MEWPDLRVTYDDGYFDRDMQEYLSCPVAIEQDGDKITVTRDGHTSRGKLTAWYPRAGKAVVLMRDGAERVFVMESRRLLRAGATAEAFSIERSHPWRDDGAPFAGALRWLEGFGALRLDAPFTLPEAVHAWTPPPLKTPAGIPGEAERADFETEYAPGKRCTMTAQRREDGTRYACALISAPVGGGSFAVRLYEDRISINATAPLPVQEEAFALAETCFP